MKNIFIFLLVAGFVITHLPEPGADTQTSTGPQQSILQVMELIITPATDTLWQADDPQTEAEWKVLEEAAIAVIDAGAMINLGGTGPEDNNWAGQPAWQAFTRLMVSAAEDALVAARNKDIDALLATGDALYSPCEACHLQFNPGVIQGQ